jgi:acetyl-CoA carboxylase biotin carboxyl carrier protein
MANSSGAPERNPFDIRLVRQLVGLMRENELTEIALQWDGARIRLQRGPTGLAAAAPAVLATAVAPASATPATTAPPPQAEPALVIKSPTVGTFYAASSPDAPPYVKVGSAIHPDTVVCQVEAMKVFNEIPAGLSGTVLEVLVENQSPVEFGQPLFRVKAG